MYKMTLEQVNLEGADLTGCKLEKSRFRQCCFDRAWMTGASLEGSDIRDSSIDGVDILGMSLKNTKIDLNQAVALAAALGAVYEP